jgi:hypothetical protein
MSNNMHAVMVTAIRKVNDMSATEKLRVLFAKRDALNTERMKVAAELNDARREWADENGLLWLPCLERIERQVMA